MKYSSKGHKDGKRHKNGMKRSVQAQLVYVFDIIRNIHSSGKTEATAMALLSRSRTACPFLTVASVDHEKLMLLVRQKGPCFSAV